jgi:quercetin dioxygenase-like cupin family protein
MIVTEQTRPEPQPIPGVAHATWAGAAEGLTQLSVWRQTLAPGAATPPHRHDCDEVVMCSAGVAEVHEDGRVERVAAGQSVCLRRDREHQIFNVGPVPLEIVAVLGASPVGTWLPDGSALALPWRT